MPVNPPLRASAAARMDKALPWLRAAAGVAAVVVGCALLAPVSTFGLGGILLLVLGVIIIITD
jgi:hypothetical protein